MELIDAEVMLSDPHLAPAKLAEIAGQFQGLRARVALHPSLYPQLRDWLVALNDPKVDAVLQPPTPQAKPVTLDSLLNAPRKPLPPQQPTETVAASEGSQWIFPVVSSISAIAVVVLVIIAIVMPFE